jgi:hypothetical protein
MAMKSNTLFFLEFLITGGAAMAWAAWEYWSIRPGRKDPTSGEAPGKSASPEDPRHTDRQHQADDG